MDFLFEPHQTNLVFIALLTTINFILFYSAGRFFGVRAGDTRLHRARRALRRLQEEKQYEGAEL